MRKILVTLNMDLSSLTKMLKSPIWKVGRFRTSHFALRNRNLYSDVVEFMALQNAKTQDIPVQNWSINLSNLVMKRRITHENPKI
jgi:hypothetical protein